MVMIVKKTSEERNVTIIYGHQNEFHKSQNRQDEKKKIANVNWEEI